MRIEKAMDTAIMIIVDHGGHQIGYDKLSFLFRQKLPKADSQMFDMVMESLKNNQCIAYGKSRRDGDKIYLTSSGVQLYIDGGVYQNLVFRKMKNMLFALLALVIGVTWYYLW
jgi:hypothetical protein